jgi:sugar fermentation stimulation protein A
VSGADAPSVDLGGPLAPAVFLRRPNRFVVRCRLAGRPGAPEDAEAGADAPVVEAHLPDPGRLTDLLVEGRRLLLRPAGAPGRKTDWTAVLVRSAGGTWVSVDTTLPNRLVENGLRRRALGELAGWSLHAPEVALGGSRIDFVLGRPDDEARLALEVKSVTLVRGRVGRFPDAVTARGTRHVRELAEVEARDGWRAAVLFVAQRPDVERISADEEIDPEFARALGVAREAGVGALGRRCRVDRSRVELGPAVPVV